MEIHFLPILVGAIIGMILGSIWYGPLFGKTWMRLLKIDPECFTDPVKKKEMQKKMLPTYAIQLVLSLLQVWILSQFIQAGVSASGLITSLWIWLGFMMPMAANGSMWSGDKTKDAWQKFFVTAGFNLVLFIILGLMLGVWN
jgi:hypothetical protein